MAEPGVGELLEQGREFYARGRRNAAIRSWKAALRLSRELHAIRPTSESRAALEESLRMMAFVSRAIGRFDVQANYLKKVMALSRPQTREERRAHAFLQLELSHALDHAEAKAESLELARAAVAGFRTLHQPGGTPTAASDLAHALERLARMVGEGAGTILDRALALREEAYRLSPGRAARTPLIQLLWQRAYATRSEAAEKTQFLALEKLLRESIAEAPREDGEWERGLLARVLYLRGGGMHRSWTSLSALREAYELLEGLRQRNALTAEGADMHALMAGDLRERTYKKSARSSSHSAGGTIAALNEAVYEQPADDKVRLVLADALTEAGDPRGEFIMLQCRPGKVSERREKQLLASCSREWLGPLDRYIELPPTGAAGVFKRGFPARVTARNRSRTAMFEETRAWATVEELTIERFEFHPNLVSLRALFGVKELGSVKIPPLETLLFASDCSPENLPLTTVGAVGCIAEDLEVVCGVLEAVRAQKWFKSVRTLLSLAPELRSAQALLERFPKIERVEFVHSLRARFFTEAGPPFGFGLSRKGELTITLEPVRASGASIARYFEGFAPASLKLVRERVSRNAGDRMEKTIIAALGGKRGQHASGGGGDHGPANSPP